MGDVSDQQVSNASATGAHVQGGHIYQEHYPPAPAPTTQHPSTFQHSAGAYASCQQLSPEVQGSNYVKMPEGQQLLYTPQVMLCPYCGVTDLSTIKRTFKLAGWLICSLLFLIFLVLWFLPICCLPCCIPSCYNVKHYCSICKRFIGECRR